LTSVLIKPKGINRIASIYCCSVFLRQIDLRFNKPKGINGIASIKEYFTSLERGYPVDAFWFLLKLRSICLRNMLQK
jgi:hypothetical protein